MSVEAASAFVGLILGLIAVGGFLIRALKGLRKAIALDVASQLKPVNEKVEQELTPGNDSMKSDLTSLVERVSTIAERVDDQRERIELLESGQRALVVDVANHVSHTEQELGDVWSTLRQEGILRRKRGGG